MSALAAAAAVAAALWLAAGSLMGRADFWLIELCRAALTGAASTPAGGGAPPLSPGLLGELWAMWVLMMAAMMLPAMSAVLAPLADIVGIKRSGWRFWATLGLFSGGYLLVWSGFSLVAAAAQLALRGTDLFSLDGSTAGPLAGGALLIVAGLWQFSSVKKSCLVKCRQPMAFLMAEWRPGLAGAARLGYRHGLHCLGCCVALMGLMFVFGAMNLWWMAAIALYCLAEKLAPAAETWSGWAGAVMIGAGAAMIGTQF
ncbi:MAG: DUF2182 domain-containing protein [Paracoccaceae bacterium]